jgi:hypothetical protein
VKDLLTNPVVLRAILAFVLALAMLVLGIMFIRRLRGSIVDEAPGRRATGKESGFALEAYH